MPRPQARIDSGTAHNGVVDLVQEMARWLFIQGHWAGLRHWCQQAVEVVTLDGRYLTAARIRRRLHVNGSLTSCATHPLSPRKGICHRMDHGDPETATAL